MEEMSKKRLRRERARLKELRRMGVIQRPAETGQEAKAQAQKPHEHPAHKRKRAGFAGFLDKAKKIFEEDYKKLLIFTVLLFVLAIGQIAYQVATTGDFINRGVSLKGGITVTIPDVNYDALNLESYLQKELNEGDISVRKLTSASRQAGLVVDAGITDKGGIDKLLELVRNELKITKDDYSVEMIGSSLGASFFKETFIAIIIAFLFMGVVVWLFFRVPAPTFYVVLCAACDIIETVAVVNLIGMKISTAGIAAYLMLVGYSVDTDMLLTARVLRRKEGTVMDGVYSAMKTGMMMSLTTIAAVCVGLFFAESSVLKEIMTILLIGLALDNLNTWIQNTGLLRLYLERNPERSKIKEG